MKKKIVFLIVLALLLQSFAVMAKDYPQKFWDVSKDHWAFEYIAELVDRGVIKGYDDGSFKPNATVSRAEWAKMMCVAGNLSSTDTSVYFRDTEGHWANIYVNAAKDYITSYNDGSFRPDQAIVREDVTRSLVTLRGYDISNVDYSHVSGFKDFDSISNYMKAYVAVAVENGLINGFEDNTFRGQGTLTRAEAATLLYRAFQKGDQSKIDSMPEEVYQQPATIEKETDSSNSVTQEENVIQNNNSAINNKTDAADTEKDETDSTTELNEEIFEKVSKAIVEAPDQITTDGENYIWFINNNEIYSHNVNTGNTKSVFSIDSLEIDTEKAYKSDFSVYSICYNPETKGLVISGHYKTVNSAMDTESIYIYSLIDGEVSVMFHQNQIPENFGYIFNILNNGDFVDDDTVWDGDTLEYKYDHVGDVKNIDLVLRGSSCVVAENETGLIFVGNYSRDEGTSWERRRKVISQYSKGKTSQLWDIEGSAFGISNKLVISFDAENYVFNIYNTLGKQIRSIELTQEAVIQHKLWIVGNYLVFYDIEEDTIWKIRM